MTIKNEITLTDMGGGTFVAPGARILDKSGRKKLPIGNDSFSGARMNSVLVDKTMLIGDVIDSDYKVLLFCRPRRFGKTLNMTMMRHFFEIPIACNGEFYSAKEMFEGTAVYEDEGGRYREHMESYPVIHFSFREAKKMTWEMTYGLVKKSIRDEYSRHSYLRASPQLNDSERSLFCRIADGECSDAEYGSSLATLTLLLRRHHSCGVVILIDEYDAPIMAAYSAPNGGYYGEAVDFMKTWLVGALKEGGDSLAFGCLTGVQRISKESIFSDLNNLYVDTALSSEFDERYGFTDTEVAALGAYLGYSDFMEEARHWYDGYRFGNVDVYNPWSVLNYFKQGCTADVYWGNTSSNSVIGDLVRSASGSTLEDVYRLMEPDGYVDEPLDLGVVFPDIGVREDAIWSMLYLAGYLTTEDTALPNNTRVPRRLHVPNAEIAELYRSEIVGRFKQDAGGNRLSDFQEALASGNADTLQLLLNRMLQGSASYYDITSENSAHMLMLGLCFGIPGFGDPLSNRERGDGRPDIQLVPENTPFFRGTRGLTTIELKYAQNSDEESLCKAAEAGLRQIAAKGYDACELPPLAHGRVRWGIAFSGKHVACVTETLE